MALIDRDLVNIDKFKVLVPITDRASSMVLEENFLILSQKQIYQDGQISVHIDEASNVQVGLEPLRGSLSQLSLSRFLTEAAKVAQAL